MVALEDIPASVLVSGANNPMGESWTCPIVIIQDHLLGGPAADEEPIPENGNVVGPAPFHLVQGNDEDLEENDTSRKQGFGSGLTSPLEPVQPRTGTLGGICPGSCS